MKGTRTVILMVAVLSVAGVRLSDPGAFALADITAILAMLTAFAILFLRAVDWSRTETLIPVTVAASVALYGFHPLTISALRETADRNLVACLAGMAVAIAICQWHPERSWQRWAALVPAIPCILLHRAGTVFAPLMAASLWLLSRKQKHRDRFAIQSHWPVLVISVAISVAAGILHRAEPYHTIDTIQSIPGMVAGFLAPFYDAQAAGWTMIDAIVMLAVLSSGAIVSAVSFELPAVSFGLIWFLTMALAAPGQAVAALPGLALAIVAGGAATLTSSLGESTLAASWTEDSAAGLSR